MKRVGMLILYLCSPVLIAAQSISLSVGNVPSAAAQVIVVIDGGTIPGNQPLVTASESGGGGQVRMNLGVPSGGPYRVRAVAAMGSGAILRSGQVGSIFVTASASTQTSITLQDVTATFESTTPSSAMAGSTVPIRLLITDPGDALAQPSTPGLNASFTPFTVNGSGTSSGNNTTTPLGAQQYRISITATLPTRGGTWYYQVSTQAMQFVVPGTIPTFYYPNVEAEQSLSTIAITATQSISLSVGNVPTAAAQVIVVIDGGTIPGNQPLVTASASGGGGQVGMNLGVPSGGPYRVRAVAAMGSGAILRSGQVGSIFVAASASIPTSITLQDVTATFESTTPSSATAGSTVPIQLLITDPGDALAQPSTPGLNASFTPFTVNGSGTSSGNNTTTPLGAQQYRISITATLPTRGGTWYYQVSTQAMQFVVPGTIPTFYYPNVETGQSLRTIAISGPLPGTLSVNRTSLNFGYSASFITTYQTVTVNISNGVNVGWTASSNSPNVTISPASGTGSGTFQVTATPPSSGGSSDAIITVSALGLTGSPEQIQVNVSSVIPTMPFGYFDTPVDNTVGIAGAVPVTGWALDNIEVTSVGIYREPVQGEVPGPNGLVFIGNANFVADARPDVAASFPNLPYQYRGGWGYLMLTNFLPNSTGVGSLGNGTYKLHAIMTNKSGTAADLGTRTITVDNAQASKPFGTIDTPDQGGNATGNAFVNFGWALTQNPYFIPMDGSTITVILDGVPVGHPAYNQYRSDIATLFPGLANSNGAVGFFYIDTTQLQNKVHTISWNAFDNAGRGDGLGSRYFNVLNANGGTAAPEEPPTSESLAGPVRLRSGYDLNAPEVELAPDRAGTYLIEMEELGRIELSLGAFQGYLVLAGEAAALPLGSTLKAGVFYWQVPVAFLGIYELLFERPDGAQISVYFNIGPKRYSLH